MEGEGGCITSSGPASSSLAHPSGTSEMFPPLDRYYSTRSTNRQYKRDLQSKRGGAGLPEIS
jgi:hypothetical protein